MGAVCVYRPPGGQRVRFLLAHQDGYRALAWMRITPDGSLVFSPATPKGGPKYAKTGAAQATENGARVNYDAGTTIDDPQERRTLHATYHASGIVNAGTSRSHARPLRSLQAPAVLFQAVYAHPSRAPNVIEPRKWDTVLIAEPDVPYPADDDRPIVGRVLAAPPGQIPADPTREHTTTLVMPFAGADDCPALDFGFEFTTGPPAPWPPYSYLVWAGTKDP